MLYCRQYIWLYRASSSKYRPWLKLLWILTRCKCCACTHWMGCWSSPRVHEMVCCVLVCWFFGVLFTVCRHKRYLGNKRGEKHLYIDQESGATWIWINIKEGPWQRRCKGEWSRRQGRPLARHSQRPCAGPRMTGAGRDPISSSLDGQWGKQNRKRKGLLTVVN